MAGIDTQEIKKDVLKRINNSILKSVLSNPLILSIVLTGIILLIVIYIFDPDENKSRIRTGVYIFLTVSISLFLHNGILMKEVDNTIGGEEILDLTNIAGGGDLDPTHLDYLKV